MTASNAEPGEQCDLRSLEMLLVDRDRRVKSPSRDRPSSAAAGLRWPLDRRGLLTRLHGRRSSQPADSRVRRSRRPVSQLRRGEPRLRESNVSGRSVRREGGAAAVGGGLAEVALRCAAAGCTSPTRSLRARRAGLDLATVRGDGEVGDRGVLGLALAVAHHARVSRGGLRARRCSSVSVSVPIWFTLTSIDVGDALSMPICRRWALVTNRSSPTSCTFEPSGRGQCRPTLPVVLVPSPSSIDTMG